MHVMPPNIPERRHSRLFTLSAKVSLNDLAAVEAKAATAGLTKSAYLRQAAISGQVQPRTVIPQINQQHWSNLSRTVANLNQVAVHLNSGGVVDASVMTVLVENLKVLTAVRSSLLGMEVPHGLPN